MPYDYDDMSAHDQCVISLRRELEEAQAEIRRHHEDFEKIRELAHNARYNLAWTYRDAVLEIRNIVG